MMDRSQNTDDTPLFQSMDEQEAAYAAQQVPGADQSDIVDSDARTDDSPLVSSFVPVAPAAGVAGAAAGGIVGGGGAAPIAPLIPTTQRDGTDRDVDTDDTTLR
jgi:hypothetical protein